MKNKKYLFFLFVAFCGLIFSVSDVFAAGVYTNKLISVPLWEEAKDMAISGQYAYVVEGNQSDTTAAYLEVFDISNPLNPVSVKLISETNFSGGAWGVLWGTAMVDGGRLYVLWSGIDKTLLNVYDISDLANPALLGSFNGIDPYVQSTIAIRGSYIYACTYDSISNHNLSIINVSNPASISVNKKFVNITGPVFVEGNYLYTENYDAVTTYLAIYNISNPADPVFVGRKAVGTSITGLTVSGDYAYIGTIQPSGVDNFYIFDISNKSNPVKTGSNSNLPGGTNRNLHNLSFDGGYIYAPYDGSLYSVLDVNDPTNPIILGSGPLVGYAMRALTYAGNYAVVISGWGGGGGGGYLNIYGEVPRYLKICQDSCDSGVLLATTSSSVPINLSKGSTMDLVACYNVANDCSDASGNVTTSATWSEGGNAAISLDPSINPALLSADNVGTEGISASYASQTASITFNVFCNDINRCNGQGDDVCVGSQVNVAGPDACGNVNFDCPGKKSCGMEIKNFREINP